MRFMLDLSPMQNSQKMERVNVSFSAVEHPHNPLHEAVKDTKRCRLEWGKSSMGPSEDLSTASIPADRELKQTKEWERYSNGFRHLRDTPGKNNLGR